MDFWKSIKPGHGHIPSTQSSQHVLDLPLSFESVQHLGELIFEGCHQILFNHPVGTIITEQHKGLMDIFWPVHDKRCSALVRQKDDDGLVVAQLLQGLLLHSRQDLASPMGHKQTRNTLPD